VCSNILEQQAYERQISDLQRSVCTMTEVLDPHVGSAPSEGQEEVSTHVGGGAGSAPFEGQEEVSTHVGGGAGVNIGGDVGSAPFEGQEEVSTHVGGGAGGGIGGAVEFNREELNQVNTQQVLY